SYLYDGGTDVGGGQLVSQVSYLYDQTDAGRLVDTPAQASQHDSAYGTSFATGRANVTSVRRVDVTNTNQYLESTAGYDTTGNVVFSRDPVGHQTSVSYADVFVDQTEQPLTGLTISTYAYPTTVTDPDGFTATTKYDYDMGAVRQVQTPLPNVTTNQPGPVQTEQYDDAGRVVKVFNSVNGAYTRFVYALGQEWVQTFSKIQDGTNNETYAIQVFDGMGRTYASASLFPGSTGGYRGQHVVYDVMGRVVQQSNPTEMTNAWEPAG